MSFLDDQAAAAERRARDSDDAAARELRERLARMDAVAQRLQQQGLGQLPVYELLPPTSGPRIERATGEVVTLVSRYELDVCDTVARRADGTYWTGHVVRTNAQGDFHQGAGPHRFRLGNAIRAPWEVMAFATDADAYACLRTVYKEFGRYDLLGRPS